MKKILSSILIAFLSVALISCGNSSTTASILTTDVSSAKTVQSSTVSVSANNTMIVNSGDYQIFSKITNDALPSILLRQSWTSTSEINPDSIINYYCSEILTPTSPTQSLSTDIVIINLEPFFGALDADYLEQSNFYNKETSSFDLNYQEATTPGKARIDSVSEDDETYQIKYTVVFGEDISGDGVLTLKNNDNFQFLSNQYEDLT